MVVSNGASVISETKLCECGCGNPAPIATQTNRKLGHRRDEPMRFIRGHATRLQGPDYVVNKQGCWVWQKNKSNGYGRTSRSERAHRAHRVFYEARFGPIPDGLVLDHLCRNRACVNPDHLEPVTQQENLKRGKYATTAERDTWRELAVCFYLLLSYSLQENGRQ